MTDGKPKGVTVASIDECTIEDMKESAESRFGKERIISVIGKTYQPSKPE